MVFPGCNVVVAITTKLRIFEKAISASLDCLFVAKGVINVYFLAIEMRVKDFLLATDEIVEILTADNSDGEEELQLDEKDMQVLEENMRVIQK